VKRSYYSVCCGIGSALPNWVEARLSNASAEQLEQWAERLLDIDSLDALFDKP